MSVTSMVIQHRLPHSHLGADETSIIVYSGYLSVNEGIADDFPMGTLVYLLSSIVYSSKKGSIAITQIHLQGQYNDNWNSPCLTVFITSF